MAILMRNSSSTSLPSFTVLESITIKHREFSQITSFGTRRQQGHRSLKLSRVSPFKFHLTTATVSQNMAVSVEAERKIFDSKSEPPTLFDGTNRLYISQMCPYAQRVWIARNYKGLDHIHVVEISLSDKPLWYKEKVYPSGKVPALEHNGKVIGESLDLLEYLDLNFGGPKICPKDPKKKGIASDLMKHADTFVKAGFSALSMKDATPTQIEQIFGPALDQLETSIQKFSNAGPFFLCDFGVVDIAYAPFIERFRLAFSHFKNYDITHVRPALARWIEGYAQEREVARVWRREMTEWREVTQEGEKRQHLEKTMEGAAKGSGLRWKAVVWGGGGRRGRSGDQGFSQGERFLFTNTFHRL